MKIEIPVRPSRPNISGSTNYPGGGGQLPAIDIPSGECTSRDTGHAERSGVEQDRESGKWVEGRGVARNFTRSIVSGRIR